MKKIGLIGGTGPESTLVYYRELNTRINERTLGRKFPEMSIESVDLFTALKFVSEDRYDELTEYLYGKIKNLEEGGAEIVALTAATMHVVYDRLKEKVSVPFVSIPEAAADFAIKKGYKKVGLLGTIFTMEKDYLSKAFTEKGVEVVVPDKASRVLVNDIISKELEFGDVKAASVDKLLSVIKDMMLKENIDAVILGCTELPLAINEENSPVNVLDIMEIHINKLVEMALEG